MFERRLRFKPPPTDWDEDLFTYDELKEYAEEEFNSLTEAENNYRYYVLNDISLAQQLLSILKRDELVAINFDTNQ